MDVHNLNWMMMADEFQDGPLCLGHIIYNIVNLELKINTNPPIKKRDCITRKSVGISDLSLHCPFLSYIPP